MASTMKYAFRFHGNCSDDANLTIFINDHLAYIGPVSHIISHDHGQHIFLELLIISTLVLQGHPHFKIKVNKGSIRLGVVISNFYADLNHELSATKQQDIYNNNRVTNDAYIYYLSCREFNQVWDTRSNICIDNERQTNEYGWVHEVLEGKTITFDNDIFRPIDYLQFITTIKPGPQGYINE